jgi:hypothetical protein
MTDASVFIRPASRTVPECPMRGIDHLAFVTDDMPSTMDF